MQQATKTITRKDVEKAVSDAWTMVEDYNEGRVVIQLHPDGTLIVTHQLGNSFASMGLNFSEAEKRILKIFDCREFEKLYWEGKEETEENRLAPNDYDTFADIIDEIENELQTKFGIEVE